MRHLTHSRIKEFLKDPKQNYLFIPGKNPYLLLGLLCGISFLLVTLGSYFYFRSSSPQPDSNLFFLSITLLSLILFMFFAAMGGLQYRLKRDITAITERLEKFIKIEEEKFKEREDILLHIIRSLVGFIESKDPYRGGHSERVCQYALKIAEGLKLMDTRELYQLAYASYLHDLGRFFVPGHIWENTGSLTQEEFQVVKQHPIFGETILLTLPGFSQIAQFVRHHHESEDGTGYPDSLSGHSLPLINKIVSVANAYDAMTSPRPYRPAFPPDVAIEELKRCSGQDFNADTLKNYGFNPQNELRYDPHVVNAFYNHDKEVIPIPKKRVLIVDDDYLTCWSLSSLMIKEGYEVTTAEDGINALEEIKKKGVDIVITDLKMPQMNGLELMEEIKKISSGTKVIIMTSHYLPETAQEAKQKGAFEFIEKPLTLEKLREVVHKALAP